MACPVERSAKELDRLSTIVAIADALGIEPVKLLPAAFTTRRRELRDSVIGTAPDPAGAGLPLDRFGSTTT